MQALKESDTVILLEPSGRSSLAFPDDLSSATKPNITYFTDKVAEFLC